MFIDDYGLRFVVDCVKKNHGFRGGPYSDRQTILDTVEYYTFCDLILNHDIPLSGNLVIKTTLNGKECCKSWMTSKGPFAEASVTCEPQDMLVAATSPRDVYRLVGTPTKEESLRFFLYCLDVFISIHKSIYGRPIKQI
jgi:hypothetical protein